MEAEGGRKIRDKVAGSTFLTTVDLHVVQEVATGPASGWKMDFRK